ncbi:hypothetical protein Mapa_007574 [Marchantia paleacea]|nr:hypothetical protein Mapa_007574 [Marchantia paleacea]
MAFAAFRRNQTIAEMRHNVLFVDCQRANAFGTSDPVIVGRQLVRYLQLLSLVRLRVH